MKKVLTIIAFLLIEFSAISQVKVNQLTTNVIGRPILGSVAFTNTVSVSNITARGDSYRSGAYVTIAGTYAAGTFDGNYYWSPTESSFSNRVSATLDASYYFNGSIWTLRCRNTGVGPYDCHWFSPDDYILNALTLEGGDTCIGAAPVVTAYFLPPAVLVTNGWIGINRAIPATPFDLQGYRARTRIGDAGLSVTTAGGNAGIVCDPNDGPFYLLSSYSDKLYTDYIADNTSDDNEDDIDVGFHILMDSAGSLPYWSVQGEFFGGFATISQVSDSNIQLLSNDYTNLWTIAYTNYAGALTIDGPSSNRKIIIATAGNYLIQMYSSFQGPGGASHLYECSVFTNHNGSTPTECPIIEWKRLTSTSDTGTAAAHGIIWLDATDEVSAYIRDVGSSGTITINKFALTVTPAN